MIIVNTTQCIGCKTCMIVCPADPSVFVMSNVAIVKRPELCQKGCNDCVYYCPMQGLKKTG